MKRGGGGRAQRLRPVLIAVAVLPLVGCAAAPARPGPRPVPARAPDPPSRLWLALGIGGSGAPGTELWGGSAIALGYERGRHRAALRRAQAIPRYVHQESFTEYGLLYGRATSGGPAHASLSAGLSRVSVCTGHPRSSRIPDVCHGAWGVPVVAEVALQSPLAGLALQAFANLNRETVYHGLLIVLQLGWMPRPDRER